MTPAHVCTRRCFAAGGFALGLSSWTSGALADSSTSLPTEVAGVKLPRSSAAIRAGDLSRRSCPEFLFNHCMRTYLFGALGLQRQKLAYNADEAFIAAALHDMGLLPAFESKAQSFEIDGANLAETFAKESGLDANAADVVWHGVAFHDGRFAITRRAGPEAMLVAIGAGSDVDGPALDTDDERKQMAEIVGAFPRLQFKRQFTQLAIDHCKRKPTSQSGTWLEGLCREEAPGAWTETVQSGINRAPFPE